MTTDSAQSSALPANRTFVVQFHPADTDGRTRFEGRIEYLVSGRAEYFASVDELWKLLGELLPGKQGNESGGD